MMNNIDYIFSIGDFEEDPQAAMLFDKMEKSIQKIKLEFQQLNLKLLQPKTPPQKGWLNLSIKWSKEKNRTKNKGIWWIVK